MRDPKRIEKVLAVIRAAWQTNPDLRLGQLLLNIVKDRDLYYLEDDEIVRRVTALYMTEPKG